MIESIREELESTVTPLLKEVLDDARKLMRQEAQLIRAEAREEGLKTKRAVTYIAAGGAIAHMALVLFALMLAQLCAGPWFNLPLWAAYGVVAVFSVVSGILLFTVGSRQLRSARESSEQAFQTLREGFNWM
jgi:hypothetical protein